MKNIIRSACAMIVASAILLEPCSGMNESELDTANNTSGDSSGITNSNIFSHESLVDLSRIDEFVNRVNAIPDPYIVLGDGFKLPESKARFNANNWIFWDKALPSIERLSIYGNAKDIEIWRVLSENLKDKFLVILDDFHIFSDTFDFNPNHAKQLGIRVEIVKHTHNILKVGGKLVTEYGFISDFNGEQFNALLERFDVYYTDSVLVRPRTSPMGESFGWQHGRDHPYLFDFPLKLRHISDMLPCFMKLPYLKDRKGGEDPLLSDCERGIIRKALSDGGERFVAVDKYGQHLYMPILSSSVVKDDPYHRIPTDRLVIEYNEKWPWRGNVLLDELIADGSLKKVNSNGRGMQMRDNTRIVLVKKALSFPQTTDTDKPDYREDVIYL